MAWACYRRRYACTDFPGISAFLRQSWCFPSAVPFLAAVMPEQTCPERWLGHQVVVTLPEQLDMSTAYRVREQLLLVINRGAAVLIADLTGTVSCDFSGADALKGAHHRAVATGTELRLVVTADVVRRMLSGLVRKFVGGWDHAARA